MRKETEVVLSSVSGCEKYDAVCKEIWKLKEIISPVLKFAVKEYETSSVDEIMRYINVASIAEDVPVDDLPPFIEGLETEMSSTTEKRVCFDLHFTAKNPKLSKQDILVKLHIDFEVQNDYLPSNPSYPITKRAVYYAARELSAQLQVVTHNTNYNNLEKVYSIWICNERVPKEMQNSFTRYYIKREDVVGKCIEKEEYHDLMEIVIIRRGDNAMEDSVFEYIEGVFTSDLQTIKKYVNVDNNDDVKEALKTMCGLGESIANKALEQGMLLQLIELVNEGDLSIEKASAKAGMTVEEFKEKLKEFSVTD